MSNGVDRIGFDFFGGALQSVFKGLPANIKVKNVTLLNRGVPLQFAQSANELSITVPFEMRDSVDTIIKCELSGPATPLAGLLANAVAGDQNLAFGKPCSLLSLDGLRPLPPNFGSSPANAVDNDIKTLAQGSMNWAWTLQVDLEKTATIQQAVITFGRSFFATRYRVKVSTDGKEWKSIVYVPENNHGGRFVHTFKPVEARYLQVCGMKPNDANQFGGQMSIAELAVYEKPLFDATPVSQTSEPNLADNLAFEKPARLLTLDGNSELLPSVGDIHSAQQGVDMNTNTWSQAGGQWPWTYEVDLQREQTLKKIVIHFSNQFFATEYRVLCSRDRTSWQEVAHVQNATGGVCSHNVSAKDIRYLRVTEPSARWPQPTRGPDGHC